jgi:hypothetical protein
LELRYWDNKDSKEIQQEQSCIEGPLIDTSSNKKGSTLYYGATEDHFLFLYTLAKEEEIQDQQLFCFKFLFSKKRYQTFPSDGSPKSLSAIIGVIDLLQIKHISYEKDILHLDQAYSFQTMHHPSHGWSTRLEAIQKHYQQGQVHDDHREIKVHY